MFLTLLSLSPLVTHQYPQFQLSPRCWQFSYCSPGPGQNHILFPLDVVAELQAYIQCLLLSVLQSYHIQHLLPTPVASLPVFPISVMMPCSTSWPSRTLEIILDVSLVLPISFLYPAHILSFLFSTLLPWFLPYHLSLKPLYQPHNLPSCLFLRVPSSSLSSILKLWAVVLILDATGFTREVLTHWCLGSTPEDANAVGLGES